MELNCHKIKIKTNDGLSQKINEFVNLLKIDYDKFKAELKAENQEWENTWKGADENKKINVFFDPEKASVKSPLTIIDAPWGTGKTFFIEQLAKMFIQDEIQDPFFKKIVVFDAWKICNYSSVVEEIVDQLVSIFLKEKDFQGANKQCVKKWFFDKMAIKLKVGVSLNLGLVKMGAEAEIKGQKNDKEEKPEEKLSKKINDFLNDLPLTLIFFDNVERLGSFSWEVIKIVQKLSSINNLILIFPMNKNKLSVLNQDLNQNGEKHIEKYIQLPWYKLEQDYLGVLKKLDINDKYINIINDVLQDSINGHNLSIRQVEKSFIMNKIINDKNIGKYKMLGILRECWNPIVDQRYKIDTIIEEDIQDFIYLLDEFNTACFKINHTIAESGFVSRFYQQRNNANFNNFNNYKNSFNIFDEIVKKTHLNNKNFNFKHKNLISNLTNLTNVKKLLSDFKDNLENFIENIRVKIEDGENDNNVFYLTNEMKAAIELMNLWDDLLIDKINLAYEGISSQVNYFWSIEENKEIYSLLENKYKKEDNDVELIEMTKYITEKIKPW